jgi:hypothetical protein
LSSVSAMNCTTEPPRWDRGGSPCTASMVGCRPDLGCFL